VHRCSRNLAVVFLGLLGVFLLELTTPAATNAPPKRILILYSFGRDVALFNEAGSGDG
jgi:hypothetical protein